MSLGGATWDAAAPIGSSDTSTPTPTSGLVAGSGAWGYYSAWWKIAPSVDLSVIVNSNGTTDSSGNPGSDGGVDTLMVIYTEDEILAAGGDPDAATAFAYDDDSGDGWLSMLDVTLPAGTTYYIRLATWDSSGTSVGAYVLQTQEWYWSDWLERPNETTSGGGFWTGSPVTSTIIGTATATSSPSPSNDKLAEAATAAFGIESTSSSPPDPGSVTLSTGFNVSVSTNLARTTWTYRASGDRVGTKRQSATIQMPSPGDAVPPSSAWPEGALAAELDPTDSVVFHNYAIGYTFEEGSYDESLSGGSAAPDDALGSWSYNLTASGDSVTLSGPFPQGTQYEGSIAVTTYKASTYDVADVSASLLFGSALARDPGFSIEDDGIGGGTYRVGSGVWRLTGQVVYRPRRIRYKMLRVVPTTEVSWWDGSVRQPATVKGWWDGSAVQPVNLLGWWDGTQIQPVLGGS